MNQESAAIFRSDCGNIILICNASTALGDIHDNLMGWKGHMVDRMVKAQKEEEDVSKKIKENSKDKKKEPEGS